MQARLFHAVVFMGAALTGGVGVVVVPALGLSSCTSNGDDLFLHVEALDMSGHHFGFIDQGIPGDFAEPTDLEDAAS